MALLYMQHNYTRCIICISNKVGKLNEQRTQLQKFYQRSSNIVVSSDLSNAITKIQCVIGTSVLP